MTSHLMDPVLPPGRQEPDNGVGRAMLLGDEAVAFGALDGGITAGYAYPGTPSTEILETVIREAPARGAVAHWCANEKTAYEQALGVSMVGGRALVAMKHVGLNVAADPFINSALVGIHGGLVVAVADDPGMHSSQNEQDSRFLADFARVPCLEPATQQEAYDMTREAFAVSERFRVPVLLRLVTRLCHGRAEVERRAPVAQREATKFGDAADWTLLPGNARRLWRELLDEQPEIRAYLDTSGWHQLTWGDGDARDLAVVTTGIARTHYRENLPDLPFRPHHLHIGAYPVPEGALWTLGERSGRILVIEEGYPYVERALRGILPSGWLIEGRESGALPAVGELTPDAVRAALGLGPRPQVRIEGLRLPARPPQLCQGCPHRDAFEAIGSALEGADPSVVAGDIGCYTLGALAPYQALESCVCMGASIGMAKGAADAGIRPVLAVIGDSTFLHSGITPLVDAAAHDTDMTVLILDNETVAMTGQQPPALPDTRLGPIVLGMGIDPAHVHIVQTHPKRVPELTEIVKREIAHPGLSVIIAVRECIEAVRKRKAEDRRKAGKADA